MFQQQLDLANKRAHEIIEEARKNRAVKLKQAKIDAEVEVQKFKQQMQGQFDAFQQEEIMAADSGSVQVKQKADGDITMIRNNASLKSDMVAGVVVQMVCGVNLEKTVTANAPAPAAPAAAATTAAPDFDPFS
eukprot:TRINITY_DN6917_c0_g1_i1.p1 TRINITY_DN6917_c0_g1~~TRINITY_DN6917_c0_g1_i1.p1  ORF type:complete len:133 (+),score=43.62 TRINITY_DN6917_c0_g1_i1:64-462(+)